MPVADFLADIPFSCNPTELVTFTNNTLGLANWHIGILVMELLQI